MLRRIFWAAAILTLIGGTYWIMSGLDSELQCYEVQPDDGAGPAETVTDCVAEEEPGFDEGGTFFVEYRLQRDRVRAREVEMLEELIDQSRADPEKKEQAGSMLLELIQLMEQELLVENMLRAQGYDDAVFFYRNGFATVMVKKGEISEREFVQITGAVAAIAGVEREEIEVITRP